MFTILILLLVINNGLLLQWGYARNPVYPLSYNTSYVFTSGATTMSGTNTYNYNTCRSYEGSHTINKTLSSMGTSFTSEWITLGY